MKKVIFATLVAVAFAACGGGEAHEGEDKDTTKTEAAPAEQPAENEATMTEENATEDVAAEGETENTEEAEHTEEAAH